MNADLLNKIHCLEFFDLIAQVDDSSVDMILCDLPYGTTDLKWDTVIPTDPMWEQFKRIITPVGAIVLTASQPFTSLLVSSNLAMFKYESIWVKSMASGFLHAKNKPLKQHENILVFSKGTTVHEGQSDHRMNYYPQMKKGIPYKKVSVSPDVGGAGSHKPTKSNLDWVGTINTNDGIRYPTSIMEYPNGNHDSQHPTQKPLALFAELIETYTRPGDLVFDPCVGSGTTALAAQQLNRLFICGDSNPEYVAGARLRLLHSSDRVVKAILKDKPFTQPLFPND